MCFSTRPYEQFHCMITRKPGTGTTIIAVLLMMASFACAPLLHAQPFGATATADGVRSVHPSVAARPILFTENIGQWPDGVRMQGIAGSTNVRFEAHQVSYSYLVTSHNGGEAGSHLDRHLLRTEFLGARADVTVEGDSATGSLSNYYLSADPSTWRSGARGFMRVHYRQLYDGIDAMYYGHDGGMKYDFIVAPGADHRQIRLRYHGAKKLRLNRSGEMEVTTAFGAVREAPPYCYQEIGGKQVQVKGAYRLLGGNIYGFSLGSYDPRYPVVVDPCLSVEYSTYFGGGGYDIVTNMAVDSTGFAYAVGLTRAFDFPTIPQPETYTENVVFISKISPDGSRLIYSTFIGQAYEGAYSSDKNTLLYESIGEDVEVTRNGEAIVAMTTNIDTLPTTANSYQRAMSQNRQNSACNPAAFRNFDGYLARLNASGRLVWGTYLGGSDNDYISDIALDANDNICITGMTYGAVCGSRGDSLVFPTTTQRFGSADALRGFETFVSVLSANGRTLQFSTLYGGTRNEFASKIAVDASNRIYILGSTNSTNLPTTTGAYKSSPDPGLSASVYDLYIARINPATAQLEYSTYFGDNGGNGRLGLGFNGFTPQSLFAAIDGFRRLDRRQGLIVERNGSSIVFAGSTRSTTLPVTGGAYQSNAPNGGGGSDQSFNVFIARMNLDAGQLLAATYLGGSDFDGLGGIVYDRFGDVAVGVTTSSSDFPISPVNIQDDLRGLIDGAIVTLSPDLSRLTYGSYVGGSAAQAGPIPEQVVTGITSDSAGGLYLYGGTTSRDLRVTPQALQKQNDYYGGYIVKFAAPSAPRVGAGLGITFDPNTCGDIQTEPMLVFNSGQSPMRVDSVGFKNGLHYRLLNPPATPFTLAPCDTLTLTVVFDASKVECSTRATDSLIILAGNAENPRVMIPMSGIRRCLTFTFLQTAVTVDRYKLGSGKYVGFTANVRGTQDQYLTITPDPGNNNIFEPLPTRLNSVLAEGTSGIAFRVNAQDTGYYCESFTATVQPCNRIFKLTICAHVTSGIFTSIDTVNYGLMSCRELDLPHLIRNTGNDTLEVNVAYVAGPNPSNVEFTENVSTRRFLAPGETTTYILPIRPKGYGKQSSTIYFQTNEGGETGRLRGITINIELDSVAFRLANASVVGALGQIVEMPITYQSLLEGRLPLEELTLMLKFDPKLLAVSGISTNGTLAAGWELTSSRYVPDGTIIKVRKGTTGSTFSGQTGRLFNVQFKVLRGDTLASGLGISLAGASAGCLTAEIDSAMLFRLNEECATPDRLIVSGRRVLKQSVPNPANAMVTIPYFLAEPNHVTLVLYDDGGREVLSLVDQERPAGESEARFDSRLLSSGVYFYRLTIGNTISETRTMVITR